MFYFNFVKKHFALICLKTLFVDFNAVGHRYIFYAFSQDTNMGPFIWQYKRYSM